MATEREVGHDVEHAAVVVAHQAQAVVPAWAHTRRGQPLVDLAPAVRVVVQHAGDLVERDARALEDVGDLRHRTGRAMGQPFAGHRGAIAQPVEGCVVDRRLGLEVEDDHRHPARCTTGSTVEESA